MEIAPITTAKMIILGAEPEAVSGEDVLVQRRRNGEWSQGLCFNSEFRSMIDRISSSNPPSNSLDTEIAARPHEGLDRV